MGRILSETYSIEDCEYWKADETNITTSGGNVMNMFQAPATYTDGYEISADIKSNNTDTSAFGIALADEILHNGSESTYNNIRVGAFTSLNQCATSRTITGTWQEINTQTRITISPNTYYTVKMLVNGSNYTFKVYNGDLLLYQYSGTYSHTINPKYYVLWFWAYTSAFSGSYKNVKVKNTL